MRFLCLSLLFFFLLAQQGSAQVFQAIVPEEVVTSIALNAKSDLPLYEKLRVEDSLYTLLREHYQYLSNEAKLKLRTAIEACGGTWDRGDFYYPMPRGERVIKN